MIVRDRLKKARTDEQGAAAVELALLAPILMVALLFVVGLGRMSHARQQVESVAADAGRAASLERNPARSQAAAEEAARRSLGRAGVSCRDLTVTTNVLQFRPGGYVIVRVSCRSKLADVAMAGFPGEKTFSSVSRVPIEVWRSR